MARGRETERQADCAFGMDLELLAAWQPTVIKGNAGEIGALAESAEVSRPSNVAVPEGRTDSKALRLQVASKGVDSVGPGFTDPANVVKMLARKKRECGWLGWRGELSWNAHRRCVDLLG